MKLVNEGKGKVFYGMHFYPGVAEYLAPDKTPTRVFLNEDTIRSMDPTFAGCPVFVQHVDDVEQNIDKLRNDADGWVIESFYNPADGKHWVKFIVVSEQGERAISQGMKLSNCYTPRLSSQGGQWNGVSFAKQVLGGAYEHLALVSHPRYDESVVMTPDKFKEYNENHLVELNRLKNSIEEGKESAMKLNLFKRTKVENGADLEGMSVLLPKSGREITLVTMVNEMDAMEEKKKDPAPMAGMDHQVKLHDGSMCNVADLLEKHKALHDELESMKAPKVEDASDDSSVTPALKPMNDEDDAKEKEKEKKDEEKKKNELEVARKKAEDKKAADKLRNAQTAALEVAPPDVEICMDKLARGQQRYGSK